MCPTRLIDVLASPKARLAVHAIIVATVEDIAAVLVLLLAVIGRATQPLRDDGGSL